MTTIRVPPLTVRSRDRTGLVTTTPLYCSTPLTVIEIRYESTFSRPFVIALTSKDGMAIGNEASGDSPGRLRRRQCRSEAGAAVAPLVPPDAVGAPDAGRAAARREQQRERNEQGAGSAGGA